jgi:hypothetical protein
MPSRCHYHATGNALPVAHRMRALRVCALPVAHARCALRVIAGALRVCVLGVAHHEYHALRV